MYMYTWVGGVKGEGQASAGVCVCVGASTVLLYHSPLHTVWREYQEAKEGGEYVIVSLCKVCLCKMLL